MQSSMTFLYVCLNQNKRGLKKSTGTGDWLDLVGEGRVEKPPRTTPMFPTCTTPWGGYAFH